MKKNAKAKKKTASKKSAGDAALTKPQADVPSLPSRETLALIVGVTQRENESEAQAVERVLYLLLPEVDKALERERQKRHQFDNIPMPEKFPATLTDFFELIVKRKEKPADGTKRLRDCLRDTVRGLYGHIHTWDYDTELATLAQEANAQQRGKPRNNGKAVHDFQEELRTANFPSESEEEIDEWANFQLEGVIQKGFVSREKWCRWSLMYLDWNERTTSKNNSRKKNPAQTA
jgi:hypothetical protein